MKKPPKLRQLYRNYQQLTEQMVAVKNRQWASENETNKAYLAHLEDAKEFLIKQLNKELARAPIYDAF